MHPVRGRRDRNDNFHCASGSLHRSRCSEFAPCALALALGRIFFMQMKKPESGVGLTPASIETILVGKGSSPQFGLFML